mgnify:CR=1 FL=1
MKRNWFYSLAYIVLWPVIHLLFLPSVRGRERIPQGNAVFCCNHSSNWDPLLIMITAGYGHQLFALAKAEISHWPVVGWILKTAGMIFVDRGKADIGAIKSALKYLKGGRQILIFPEGTRVSEEESAAAKGGVSMLAVRTGSPIVPIYLDSQKKLFHRTHIVFGEPYMPQIAGKKGTAEEYQKIADEALRRIYALREESGR